MIRCNKKDRQVGNESHSFPLGALVLERIQLRILCGLPGRDAFEGKHQFCFLTAEIFSHDEKAFLL